MCERARQELPTQLPETSLSQEEVETSGTEERWATEAVQTSHPVTIMFWVFTSLLSVWVNALVGVVVVRLTATSALRMLEAKAALKNVLVAPNRAMTA